MHRRTLPAAAIAAAALIVDLPERGIRGNSHMMMDHNNLEVAGLIQDWLTAKGLWA